MYLELADNNEMYLQENAPAPAELYVYVPAHLSPTGESKYVLESEFDDLNDQVYQMLMDALDPYQEQNLELFGLGKKGRKRRQKRREERRAKRHKRRMEKIHARGQYGGGGGVGGFVSGLANTVTGLFGGGGDEDPSDDMIPEKSGLSPGAIIGIGAGALALIGIIVVTSKKK